MGDTGSLALGGIIGVFAILIRKELLLPILCGIFIAEFTSSFIQRFYFKYTRMRTARACVSSRWRPCTTTSSSLAGRLRIVS